MPKFCHRLLPQASITVVEISAEVIALREAFAIPADDDRFRVVHADAAQFLEQGSATADVILVDVFDHHGVSHSLNDAAVYRNLVRSLAPRGLIVMNLCGLQNRFPAHIAHLQRALRAPVRVVDVAGVENVLIFGGSIEGPPDEPLHERASEMQHRIGLPFRRYLERIRLAPELSRV